MMPGVFLPQHAGGFGEKEKKKINKSTFVISLLPDQLQKESPTQLNCHFKSVLQGTAANMRWLPFSVEQELSGNWNVNALRLFLHLLPQMPLKYQVSAIKICLVTICIWKDALRQEEKKIICPHNLLLPALNRIVPL